jgi:DNA-3-methyladenine glycosylase II
MNPTDALMHLRKEPFIRSVIDTTKVPEMRPSGLVYFDLLESIISQQLSVKAADTIFNRVLDLFPNRYPEPKLLRNMSASELRDAGLSGQKSAYVQNVAQFSMDTNLEQLDWDTMTDEQVIDYLTQIKGVGKWTVQMVLMSTLGRPNVFPVDDLGIQQAMVRLFNLKETGKELKSTMVQLAEPWQPYRTVACRYLWRWKDQTKK